MFLLFIYIYVIIFKNHIKRRICMRKNRLFAIACMSCLPILTMMGCQKEPLPVQKHIFRLSLRNIIGALRKAVFTGLQNILVNTHRVLSPHHFKI